MLDQIPRRFLRDVDEDHFVLPGRVEPDHVHGAQGGRQHRFVERAADAEHGERGCIPGVLDAQARLFEMCLEECV